MAIIPKGNLIPLLEKYYESFINEKDEWTFFLELAEYLELVSDNIDTNEIIKRLNAQKEEDLKALGEMEEQTLKELEKSKREIIKRLKKSAITSKAIEIAFEEIRAMEEGRVLTSTPKPVYINYELRKLAEALREEKEEDVVSDFKGKLKTSCYPVDDYVFSPSLREYEVMNQAMDFKEKTTLWYVWDHLQWAYLVIKKSNETLSGMKEKKNRDEEEGFTTLIHEMEKIQGHKDRLDPSEKLDPIWFKREDFIHFSRRFHKYVVKSLLENNPNQHHLTEDSPYFDFSSGILWIDGVPVKFGTKSKAYNCLKAYFSIGNLTEETFFSEIGERMDLSTSKPDKLIHNYFNNTIKPKIALETHIKDFFITDNQSVKISENYIKKKS
jgi:hypothetical protein